MLNAGGERRCWISLPTNTLALVSDSSKAPSESNRFAVGRHLAQCVRKLSDTWRPGQLDVLNTSGETRCWFCLSANTFPLVSLPGTRPTAHIVDLQNKNEGPPEVAV
mmetsp:Transcript_79423/g.199573  ORF Transcript_79423/g.199573 Transcript_79423/m.199573 type:complete len:107 (+) Transcript_79423:404-724(+)